MFPTVFDERVSDRDSPFLIFDTEETIKHLSQRADMV